MLNWIKYKQYKMKGEGIQKQDSMNYPWGNDRRFNVYAAYMKKLFGERVQKVSVNAGFTCPNRDGVLAYGGCDYCNNNAFNPSYCDPEKPIDQQIRLGIEFHKKRYRRAANYLAYFQPYSNTYAPLPDLVKIYDQALNVHEIKGLVIGTRPDCIDEEKLNYFSELAKKYYVIIEYGIESCYNKTLEKINRKHSFEQAENAIEKTAKKGIRTGAHLIFGLPGETKKMMLDEAMILSKLPLHSVKFHQLQILKNTAMEKQYHENPDLFDLFTLDEYIDFFVDFAERLNPAFIIERFAGEVPPRFLVNKGFGLIRNDQLVQKFEKRMEERDTWQGRMIE